MSRHQAGSTERNYGRAGPNKGSGGGKEPAKGSGARNFSAQTADWISYLLSIRGLRNSTVERYRYLLARALADMGLEIVQVERQSIEAHLKKLYLAGAGSSVREGTVVALKAFFEWAADNGLVEGNPARGLVGPQTYRRELSVLTVAEVKRLIWGDRLPRSQRSLRDRALLAVAYFAGLRASEVGRLREEQLRWDEARKSYSILVAHGKAATADNRLTLDRPVSRLLGTYLRVRPATVPWLFPSWRGSSLSRTAIRDIFLRRIAEAGIEKKGRRLSPHILRHSIATHLLHKGVDIKTVQLHLRHRSIKTTELYLHSDSERVARSVLSRSPLESANHN
jgi:site-specific recombinase XerD